MQIDILSLFPEMFGAVLGASILHRAQESDLLRIRAHNIRDYTKDKHRITDEPPYGGGSGMVLKPEPIFAAIESVLSAAKSDESARKDPITPLSESSTVPIILLTPQGRPFTQDMAWELSKEQHLILLCGRYEGVDERVRQHLVTEEISIGDFVLTGGELAAMVVVDAVTRLLPGAIGGEGAAEQDSFADGLLEGPHYTRPATFRDWPVPELLRSGHAANISRWRRQQALRRTWDRRPDLLIAAELSDEDKWYLMHLAEEAADKLGWESPTPE